MKLITEHLESQLEYSTLTEEKSGKKKTMLEGIFMQADQKNRNGRMYPKAVLESAVNKYLDLELLTNVLQ